MKIQRMPEDIVPLLNDLIRRLTALETRPLGTVFVNETIVAKDPVTGVETVIGNLEEYGEDRTGIKQWVNDTEPPATPVMPIVTSNLGVFSIVWTGFFKDDAPMAPDFSHLNVYGNDGTSTTLVGVIKTKDEVAIVTSDSEGMYDKNWSFWFTSVDQVGNESAPGEISSNNKLTPLVESPDIQGAIDQIIEETKKDFEEAMAAANGKNDIYHRTEMPPGTNYKIGDIWFDTDDENKIYVWDGTKWDPSSASSEIPQSVLDDILYAKGRSDVAYTLANGKNKRVDSVSNPPGSVTNYIAGDHWLKWSNLGSTGVLLQSWTVKNVSGTLTWVKDSMDPSYLPKVDIGEGTFGSLHGDRIRVNTLSTNRLLVGATDNVIPDPTFTNNGSDWLTGTSSIYTFPASEGRDGGSAIKIVQTGAGQQLGRYSAKVPAVVGDSFRITVWVKCSVNAPANSLAVYVNRYQPGETASSNPTPVASNSKVVPANTWVMLEGTYKVLENSTHISFGVFKQTSLGASETWFSDFSAIRMSGLTLIEDGAITTEKVKALELTVAKGTVSVLDAGAISVGKMNGKYIEVNTLMASRVAITSVDNLVLDNSYSDPDYWTGLSAGPGSGFVDPPTPNAPDAPKKVVLLTSKAQGSNMALYNYAINSANRIAVEPGDFYSIWSYVYGDSEDPFMTSVSQQVYFYDASGTLMSGSLGNQSAGSLTKTNENPKKVWTTNEWRRVGSGGVPEETKLIEVPAGAAFMSPRLTIYKTANTAANSVKYYVSAPHVTRATDGKLVVDGSITALSLATDSVESRHVKANAISADKIEAGAIKTTHLAVGTGRELVGNGSGQLKNNNGFEGFTYVPRAADVPVGHPGYFRSTAGQKTTNFLTGDNILRIKPNTKYRISVWVRANLPGSKVYLEPMVGSTSVGERPVPTYPIENKDVPTTWTPLDAVITTTGASSGTMYFRWFINHTNGTETNSIFYFTGFSVEEMVEGTVISDGAISTGKLAANSVSADKMTIGVGTNLFGDPRVIDKDAWLGNTGISIIEKGGRTPDSNALRITDNTSGSTYTYFGYNNNLKNRRFRVEPGRTYLASAWIKPSVDVTVGSNIRFFGRLYAEDGDFNKTYSWPTPSNADAGYLTDPIVVGGPPRIISSGTWTKFEREFYIPEVAEGFYFCLGPYLAGGYPNGQYVDWTDFSVTEMMSGELVVNGAIDGQVITGAVLQTSKLDRTGIKLNSDGFQVFDTEGSQTVSITPGSGVDYMGFFGRPIHKDQYFADGGWILTSLAGENYVFFKPRTDGDPFQIGTNVRFTFKAKYFVDPDNPTKTSMPVNVNVWTYPESSWGDTAGNVKNSSATFTIDSTEREYDVTIPITSLASNYQSWISGLQAMDGTAYNQISIQDSVGIKDVVSYIDGVEVEVNPRQHQAGIDRQGELLGQNLKVMGNARFEDTVVINGDPMDGHGSGDYGPVYMGRDLLGATYTNFFNDNHGESSSAWLTPMPHGLLSNSYHNGWNGTTTNYWTLSGAPGGTQVLTHLRDTVEIKRGRGYLITYTTPAFKVTDNGAGSPGACVLKYAEGRTLGVDSGTAVNGSRFYLSGGPDFDNPGRTVYAVGGQDLPVGDVTIGVEMYVYNDRKIQSTGTADARYWSLNILDVGSAVWGSTGNSQSISKKRPVSTEPAPVDPPPAPKPPVRRTYTKTWNASWWGTWWVGNGNGRNSGLDKDGKVAQGKPPGVGYRQRGAVGFPDMKGTLDGKDTVIKKVELYVYAAHWYSSAGGTLQIGTHNHASKPTTWSGGTTGVKNQKLAKPEGRWITLPTSVHAGVKGGSIKGIQVYTTSTGSSYYGYLTGSKTKIRVTYEK